MTNRLIKLSFVLFLALLFFAGYSVWRLGGWSLVKNRLAKYYPAAWAQVLYTARKDSFDIYPVKEGSIVFIGDSLTQRCEWSELLENSQVINRGLDSDKIEGVRGRLQQLVRLQPKAIFLMIGINNITSQEPMTSILSQYQVLLEQMKNMFPNVSLFVQSVLPITGAWKNEEVNERIQVLNVFLREQATLNGYSFIDLSPAFSVDNRLNGDLTMDGIHLNGKGYLKWRDEIHEFISSL